MTSTSVHLNGATCIISAQSTETMGAPLIIEIKENGSKIAEFTIFTEDQAYTDRLIQAINATLTPDLMCDEEAA